jgi:hypothetical protein
VNPLCLPVCGKILRLRAYQYSAANIERERPLLCLVDVSSRSEALLRQTGSSRRRANKMNWNYTSQASRISAPSRITPCAIRLWLAQHLSGLVAILKAFTEESTRIALHSGGIDCTKGPHAATAGIPNICRLKLRLSSKQGDQLVSILSDAFA